MKFNFATISKVGNYRKNNQDYLGYEINKYGQCLAIVCDGMGGHLKGEIASKMAVKNFIKIFKKTDFSNYDNKQIVQWIETTIKRIIELMRQYASVHIEAFDMGTTLTALMFIGDKVFSINIGDSRTYSFKKNELHQITVDQNIWNGSTPEQRDLINETKNYGRFNEKTYWKALTSALGPRKTMKIDIGFINNPTGLFMLTTDGIHDYMIEDEVCEILKTNEKLKLKANQIVEHSLSNMSTDNVSIMLVEVGD